VRAGLFAVVWLALLVAGVGLVVFDATIHRRVAEAKHCREFRAARPADEVLITGAAHYCQFDEVDGSIGFTAEACGCK
jgi:hypothetical protein